MSKAKIIASLCLVAAVAAATVGSTIAVFSDQGQVAGNTVAMGTLDVTVNHSAGKPITVTNAYPGWMMTNYEYLDIFNTGLIPLEAHFSFQKTDGDTTLYNYLVVELRSSGGDSNCDTTDPLIYSGKIKDFTPQLLVSTAPYWHLANEDDGSGSPADNIRIGWSMRICQKVGVHNDAPNSVMGKTVTFSEIVDAMQDND